MKGTLKIIVSCGGIRKEVRIMDEMNACEIAVQKAEQAVYAKLLAEIFRMKAEYPADKANDEIVNELLKTLQEKVQ